MNGFKIQWGQFYCESDKEYSISYDFDSVPIFIRAFSLHNTNAYGGQGVWNFYKMTNTETKTSLCISNRYMTESTVRWIAIGIKK